ncbi:MAG: 2-aminoethylphosphonate--pyruvate transaminase [Armatimonadota bacterium]|nr:2-aminoethylphosphonate--pyruvate transaminase [Armatimonadota bacterium]
MRTDDVPVLLTPGPLTTSRTVREAMLRDWGSRDAAFVAMTARVRRRLVELAGGEGTHEAVLLQGSGTFGVEAMLGTFVPRDGKVLVLANGAYGRRMVQICRVLGRAHAVLEWAEDQAVDPQVAAAALATDAAVTHVAVVYSETTSGIVNPLAEVADVVAAAGRRLLVDAMSAFGALPCDTRTMPYDALVSSPNKCLEGVPGATFVIARRTALETAAGNAPSVVLDLADQWRFMEETGQWRFTPPTHVLAALDRALEEHAAEGGSPARLARYRRNCQVLMEGMRALGFRTLLPDALQGPVIVTFLVPSDPRFDFQALYDRLARRGYLIYPGKLTRVDSFRIGCIGRIDEGHIRRALAAIRAVLEELGVQVPVTTGA